MGPRAAEALPSVAARRESTWTFRFGASPPTGFAGLVEAAMAADLGNSNEKMGLG